VAGIPGTQRVGLMIDLSISAFDWKLSAEDLRLVGRGRKAKHATAGTHTLKLGNLEGIRSEQPARNPSPLPIAYATVCLTTGRVGNRASARETFVSEVIDSRVEASRCVGYGLKHRPLLLVRPLCQIARQEQACRAGLGVLVSGERPTSIADVCCPLLEVGRRHESTRTKFGSGRPRAFDSRRPTFTTPRRPARTPSTTPPPPQWPCGAGNTGCISMIPAPLSFPVNAS
jgi:hypothetical protein